MKMHCYFLLNIKHRASQFYLGRPPNTTMRPRIGEGGGASLGASLGPGGLASLRPPGGLQLSSAGTEFIVFCTVEPITVRLLRLVTSDDVHVMTSLLKKLLGLKSIKMHVAYSQTAMSLQFIVDRIRRQ